MSAVVRRAGAAASRAAVGPGYMADYEQSMRAWGAAERTIEQRLALFCADPPAGIGEWLTATPEQLQAWLGQAHFAAWTRCTYFNHVTSLYGWLCESGRIEKNPLKGLRRPKTGRSVPKPLPAIEVTRVLDAAAEDRRHVHAWLLLGLYAGLRAHEIAKIRGEDVTSEFIYVNGKGGKQAFLPTHPLILELAGRYPATGCWFPSWKDEHVASETVTYQVSRLFRRLGIQGSIHRCRHTYATNLLRAGVNLRVVQTLMRHESLATTAAYLAVDEDERRAAVNLLGGPS